MRYPTKRTLHTEEDIDKSIEERVKTGQFYWKGGQLYQNMDYVPEVVLSFNKKRR